MWTAGQSLRSVMRLCCPPERLHWEKRNRRPAGQAVPRLEAQKPVPEHLPLALRKVAAPSRLSPRQAAARNRRQPQECPNREKGLSARPTGQTPVRPDQIAPKGSVYFEMAPVVARLPSRLAVVMAQRVGLPHRRPPGQDRRVPTMLIAQTLRSVLIRGEPPVPVGRPVSVGQQACRQTLVEQRAYGQCRRHLPVPQYAGPGPIVREAMTQLAPARPAPED
jgi:hypothetical protein